MLTHRTSVNPMHSALRVLAEQLQAILLQSAPLTTADKTLIQQYRKEFAWIHQMVFPKTPTKPPLRVVQ